MSAVRYAIPPKLTEVPVDRHSVIEASAGTGKTYLIEHRVVDLLLRGVELEQILVVTFTEKATEELRARVRALIDKAITAREHTAAVGEPHWLIDADARHTLRRALHGFDAAPIYTIHGFCYRVLTENAFANRRLFEQTQTDRASAFGAAFKGALREVFARDPGHRAYLEPALRTGMTLPKLEKLLLACAQTRGVLEPAFDETATAAALAALPFPAPDALAADADALTEALRRPRQQAKTAAAALNTILTMATLLHDYRDDGELVALLAGVEREQDAISSALEQVSKGPYASDEANELRAFVLAFVAAAAPLHAALVQRCLPVVVARMAADKRRLGRFDFDDMLELVWQSLEGEGRDELSRRLREQYAHALIDEFQDTDELQWKIFEHLFVKGDGSNTLCVIGDPKQAIYSFRGADVHTYLKARETLREVGGALVPLTDNYRATEPLVAAYNELLLQRATPPLFTGEIVYDKPVVARADVHADGEPVVVLRLQPRVKLGPPLIKKLLGPAIAAEIRAAIGTLRWRDREGEHVLSPGDVFVLTRSTGEAIEIADMLRAGGVPAALYKQEGLFQTREASDLLQLLRGIAEPRRQAARLQAWQTPFFAVPLADLLHARDLPETHPLIARLLDWRRLADRHAWERLFDAILADSGILRRELFLRDSERELTNYMHICELLLDEARASRLDLAGLVRYLAGYTSSEPSADGSDRGVQRLESERHAVQVMTMHKAKGLEAPVVFLFGSFGSGPGDTLHVYHRDGKRVAHIGGLLAPELRELAAEEKRQEEQRLIYVALTRAKVRLYLPHIASEHCNRVTGSYTYLRRQVTRVLDDPRFRIVDVDADARAATEAPAGARPLEQWQPRDELLAEPEPDPRVERWREERRGPAVTSYTRMKQRRSAAAPPLESEEFRADLDRGSEPASPDELPGGTASGVFLHDVLERLPFDSFAGAADFDQWRERDDVARLFRSQMLRHGRAPEHLEHAQRLIYDSLTAPVELAGDPVDGLWRCANNRREVEFVYPSPADGAYVKGYIDLLFEHGDRVYLLDWKSDNLPDYGAAALAAHAGAHYDLQITLYTRAAVRWLGIRDEADYAARFGGMAFCFLRGPGLWWTRPPWQEVRP